MTALLNKSDIFTHFGENGHIEYGWSNNIQEKIVQFNFQLTRTPGESIEYLSHILSDMLTELKQILKLESLPEKQLAKGYLSILYKMIGHTRDIIDGKGEYNLSYMMIYIWDKFFPELARFALKCFVNLSIDDKTLHPYGSWKDIKYFCQYCKDRGENINFPLIQYSIKLINKQINNDYINLISNCDDISLVSKWVPREKSKFGWLYESLATDYFKLYMETAITDNSIIRATLKCKTDYRKLISSLNNKIDTLQIKQCRNDWKSIDFNNVTSISLLKQRNSFLNVNKNGKVRHSDNIDRVTCAENFNKHIQKAVNGEVEMKGKRISMVDFTKEALNLLYQNSGENIQTEKDLLNSQWRDNSSQNSSLGKMIAMVDVSGSMEGDPLYAAIALGIRIAEKSILGKRVMTFSSSPKWVNLEPYNDFISQVEVIRKAPWGMNTNFYAALNMILNAIVENKMYPEDVQDMVLVILSDMQMDSGDHCNKKTLYETIKTKYEEAGMRIHGRPYKPPHILFWNLRSTRGFPTLSNQPNTSMMSGFSPVLLNLFCEQGLDALQSCTPWLLLIKSLENERYKILETEFNNI
jgi:Mg-chelatase subunit ChlD